MYCQADVCYTIAVQQHCTQTSNLCDALRNNGRAGKLCSYFIRFPAAHDQATLTAWSAELTHAHRHIHR